MAKFFSIGYRQICYGLSIESMSLHQAVEESFPMEILYAYIPYTLYNTLKQRH